MRWVKTLLWSVGKYLGMKFSGDKSLQYTLSPEGDELIGWLQSNYSYNMTYTQQTCGLYGNIKLYKRQEETMTGQYNCSKMYRGSALTTLINCTNKTE
jgi:hypothetical protein